MRVNRKALGVAAGKPKYGNRKVATPDGTFDSVAEHAHWLVLKARQADGDISDLKRQQTWKCFVNDIHVCSCRWDFQYIEDGQQVVADAKSAFTRTLETYRLKAKLFRACYPDVIFVEVVL